MRQVLSFGIIGGILIAALKWTEYRFLVLEHSANIYGGLIALLFALLGLWIGRKLTVRPKQPDATAVAAPTPQPSAAPPPRTEEATLTRRELEILQLIASGLSNREMAEKLFVSENTVKTHCSRVFDKLGAHRRTQAVQLGKELGLIP